MPTRPLLFTYTLISFALPVGNRVFGLWSRLNPADAIEMKRHIDTQTRPAQSPNCYLLITAISTALMLNPSSLSIATPVFVQDADGALASPTREVDRKEVCARILESMPPPSFDRVFVPDVTRRDLGVLAEELQLDTAQQIILESLLSDYEQRFRSGVEHVRLAIVELRPASAARRLYDQRAQRTIARQQMVEQLREKLQKLEQDQQLDVEQRQRLIQEAMAQFERAQSEADPEEVRAARQEMISYHERTNELTRQWLDEKTALREQLDTDLQALLSKEQFPRWHAADRRLRRTSTLPWGTLSGEYVDLFTIVADLELSDDDHKRIAPLLDSYAEDLDVALVTRNAFLFDSELLVFDALRRCSITEAMDTLDRLGDLRARVRNVHDQAAELIASQLTEPEASRFRQRWGERAYPLVLGTARTTRLFNSALALESLDDTTRTALMELRLRYDAENQAMSEELLQRFRAVEPHQEGRELEHRVAELEGRAATPSDQDEALAASLERRAEMQRSYMAQIRELLGATYFQDLLSAETQQQRGQSVEPQQRFALTDEQRRDLFRKYDLDGDGHLSDREIELMQADLQQQVERTREPQKQ